MSQLKPTQENAESRYRAALLAIQMDAEQAINDERQLDPQELYQKIVRVLNGGQTYAQVYAETRQK
jgi:hypothetical protein